MTSQTTSKTNSADWKSKLQAPQKDERPQTEDVTATKGSDFEDFYLKRELLMGIFEAGFEKPSPIQEEAIPVALAGKDILARAKNGTGKTAAFVIPALQQVNPMLPHVQAVILVPTRELALQTSQVCKTLSKHMGLEIMVTTGGTTLKDDILRLQEPVHMIVATPGRLLDLAQKEIADLKKCKTFIMDEADKLLSKEFTIVVEQLLAMCAPERQVMLFSATFPMIVKDFRDRNMRDAHEINLMEELTLKGVTQYYAFVEERQKVQCLNTLFSKVCLYTTMVDKTDLLLYDATDLLTRGIDIQAVNVEDRHNLYRIEQELGTQIAAIPSNIDPKLYVAPSTIADEPVQSPEQRPQVAQQQSQQQAQTRTPVQQPQLPPSGNINQMRAPQQRVQTPQNGSGQYQQPAPQLPNGMSAQGYLQQFTGSPRSGPSPGAY
ncbi:hypothetical protein QFC19_005812 [Naganishia cerealis]|uniref:Uncharacterized protein n=1 Tax=Naganishia cerealis TaxID=610337 RepID=A0ACC2VLM5_9TREE|nr:hypothetical protein QFC19_005812 [Naganishia cerealis]